MVKAEKLTKGQFVLIIGFGCISVSTILYFVLLLFPSLFPLRVYYSLYQILSFFLYFEILILLPILFFLFLNAISSIDKSIRLQIISLIVILAIIFPAAFCTIGGAGYLVFQEDIISSTSTEEIYFILPSSM
jgi:hypothetical protein